MTSITNNIQNAEFTEPFKTICNEIACQLEAVCGQKVRTGKTVFIAGNFELVISKGHIRGVFGVAETFKVNFKLTNELGD